MEAVSASVTCRRCGHVDIGKFCSECGESLRPHHPALQTAKVFAGPLWDFALLVKDVIWTKDLVDKIRSGRINYLNVIAFTFGTAAICTLIGYCYPERRLLDDVPPLVDGILYSFVIICAAGIFMSFTHLFLRKKNPNVTYVQSMLLVTTIFCVAIPLAQLAGTPDGRASIPSTIVNFGVGIVTYRAYKRMYEVRYRDVFWANMKGGAIILLPVTMIAGLLYGSGQGA